MSTPKLKEAIEALNSVSDDAKQLLATLKVSATGGKEIGEAQKKKIERLARRLDTSAREASRERRRVEIKQLSEIIEAHELSLGTPGLSRSAREAIKADLTKKRARRARLTSQEATDFGGILKAGEADELASLVKKAMAEVKAKKKAALFLDSVFQIADRALTLAGKLAL